LCDGQLSRNPVIQIHGQTDLIVTDSTFEKCNSLSDGSAIQSTGAHSVVISGSMFIDSFSLGGGGAVFLEGGNVHLSRNTFQNCSAAENGGALSVIGCTSSISRSIFRNCISMGWGGAVAISGGTSAIDDVSVSACSSKKDGGAIMQFGAALVNISHSAFLDVFSGGFGGAVTIVGGTSRIFGSKFLSCKSVSGGGAIYVSESQCYGATAQQSTELQLDSVEINGCTSDGPGGALLLTSVYAIASIRNSTFSVSRSHLSGGAISITESARMKIDSSRFINNSCTGYGGAIFTENSGVVSVASTKFSNCKADHSGGAIAMVDAIDFTVNNCSFIQNEAHGAGGGAVYSKRSLLQVRFSSYFSNSALRGGGGCLFWEGDFEPTFITSVSEYDSIGDSPFKLQDSSGVLGAIGNQAAYGPCFASSGKFLALIGMPSFTVPAYPGLPFAVSVLKKDAYNQTIITDSNSVLFSQSATMGQKGTVDPFLSISGKSIAQFYRGEAEFSLVLKPTYSDVVWNSANNSGFAVLASQPYVYFHGTDDETLLPITSDSIMVVLESGSKVCPAGYVLALDTSQSSDLRAGTCVQCLSGKYSVNPLAGIFLGKPSCFNCPAGGVCNGGNVVLFRLGIWVIADGMFRLVSCPAGHHLFNLVGGQFSHDIQQCIACSSNQYIINSNSSFFSCQACPLGARCDGKDLFGLVPGSVWVVNMGQYMLSSCPAGYDLLSALQQCRTCPTGYYCPGGYAIPCPSGQFSKSGSNSSSACMSALFVSISVSLPIRKDNFTEIAQENFVTALSLTANVESDSVIVESVNEMRRRGAVSLLIDSQIAVKDFAAASSVASRLSSENLNRNLISQELPQAAILSIGLPTTITKDGSNMYVVIIAVTIGGSLFLSLAIAFLFRRIESDEERELRLTIDHLRSRLKIMPVHGFLLSTESRMSIRCGNITNLCRRRNEDVVVLQRSYLEAAAHLALLLVGF
jgi:predicted outer membrane repeat protein